MTCYILDSNFFIQAKNISYPFDIFPIFWSWLEEEFSKKHIVSIEPIYNELTDGNDELAEWAKTKKDLNWFLNIDDVQTQQCYAKIAEWAVSPRQRFKTTAQSEFLSVGDSWLVAKALAIGAVIVTHETYDANCIKRIKIPNVCKAFNISYINSVELLRRLKAKF